MTDNNNSCQMKSDDYESLQKLPGNMQCVDCLSPNPDWGSPKLGVLFCMSCSGHHRGLGTHLSFVRSVTMDQWTTKQIQCMKIGGGNSALNEYLQSRGGITNVTTDPKTAKRDFYVAKYDNPVAELYRQQLSARVDGRPVPTELIPKPTKAKPSAAKKKKMEGFGSSSAGGQNLSFNDGGSNKALVAVTTLTTAGIVTAGIAYWLFMR